MISSTEVANYLNQIAQNERKLQYCRQILAQNTHFTPQTVFNINSQQTITTLSKRQFIQIVKFIGVGSNQTEIEHIFTYFQIDAKNYITLEEFTNIILPQTNQSLKNMVLNRRVTSQGLDYSLKYCLQKFFAQILENKVKVGHYCKLKFDKKQISKMKYRKIDLQNIKTFLTSHGKFPNQNVLETILKEIMLNKGVEGQNKILCEYIVEYNETNLNSNKNKNPIKQPIPYQIKQITENTKSQNKSRQISRLNFTPKDKALQDVSKEVLNSNMNEYKSKTGNQSNNGVDQRIKTLMDSINIKNHNQQSVLKIATKRISKIPESFDQKQNTRAIQQSKVKRIKPQRQFSQIQIYSKRLPNKDYSVFESKQDPIQKRKIYQMSKLCSEENFESKDKNVIRPCSRTITFSDESKQNCQNHTIRNSQINRKNENAKRLQYLKSLVDQKPREKVTKQIPTYRF